MLVRAIALCKYPDSRKDEEPWPNGIVYELPAYRRYCTNALTVAWRSILLPDKCFTTTVSFGWHHLTSLSREDLNIAQDVVRRSTTVKN